MRHIPSDNIGLCDECGIDEDLVGGIRLSRVRVETNIEHKSDPHIPDEDNIERVSLDLFLCGECKTARMA